jgi:hypothetical protein
MAGLNQRRTNFGTTAALTVILFSGRAPELLAGEVLLTPVADGTIVDGGAFGPFDGQPDQADWTFNDSGYDGAITRSLTAPAGLEHRVVFEYDLRSVTFDRPMVASLTFTLRGAARFPAAPTPVTIDGYAADLVERASDFAIAPAARVGGTSIAPFQSATSYTIDVSELIDNLLDAGGSAVGFRFQIDPDSANIADQAFMDAVDADEKTKPLLLLIDRMPGDFNGDRTIDGADTRYFSECIRGPGVAVEVNCRTCDLDYDGDVDLCDYRKYVAAHGRFSQ